MENPNQVDLFLIGKTGEGKSSTGNSILDKPEFEVSDSSDSETYEVQVGRCRRLDRIFKVVDGPGLCETRLSRSEAADKMMRDMCQGILQCPNGFHALLLVLRYGARYTEEDMQTVEMLKAIFGPTFVRDFCILIFTHGENFDMNNSGPSGKTFADWCQERSGALQAMLSECSYRAVLFYNKSPDKSDSQLQRLLTLVDNLRSRGKRYTNELFSHAAKTREQLIVRENAPQLRESIQARVDLLVDGLQKLKVRKELNDEVRALVQQLRQDAHDLATDIVVQDKGTGVLNSLKQIVANLLKNIDSQEEALKERKDKVKMEKALAEAQQKFDKDLKQLRDEQESQNRKGKIISGVQAVASFLPFLGPVAKAAGAAGKLLTTSKVAGHVAGIATNVAAAGYNMFSNK